MSTPQMQQHIQFHNNQPSFPVTPPHRRHFITQVSTSRNQSPVRPGYYNTVISPKVDIQADIDAINLGAATHKFLVGADGKPAIHACSVNGRTYGIKSNTGASYPISGQEFHNLHKDSYVSLGIYNTYGNTPRAKAELKQKQLDQSAFKPALAAWVEGGRLNRSLQSLQQNVVKQNVVTSPAQVTPQPSTKNQLDSLKQVKSLVSTPTPTVTQSTIASLKTASTSSSSPSQQSHQVAIAQNNKKPKPNSPSMS